MNKQIQLRVSTFNEVTFPTELRTRTLILKIIGFATIVIVGFGLTIAEVKDITIRMV
jgi:hypothetical protein